MGRARNPKRICRRCQQLFLGDPTVRLYRGMCPGCRGILADQRRAVTGARAISKGRITGTEVRGEQEFTVTVLPPKRPPSRSARLRSKYHKGRKKSGK